MNALIAIPAGEKSVPCQHCKRDVYYVSLPGANRIPVEIPASTPNVFPPSKPKVIVPHDGQGLDHIPLCRGTVQQGVNREA